MHLWLAGIFSSNPWEFSNPGVMDDRRCLEMGWNGGMFWSGPVRGLTLSWLTKWIGKKEIVGDLRYIHHFFC